MKKYLIPATFCALVGTFVVIASMLFIPGVMESLRGYLILIIWAIFSLLGAVLIVLTLKQKVEGKLKKSLILTGAASAGFFISIVLHNLFYALGVITEPITVLNYLMEALHTVFFIIAIPICPLAFLIGVVFSMVLLLRKRRGQKNSPWSQNRPVNL